MVKLPVLFTICNSIGVVTAVGNETTDSVPAKHRSAKQKIVKRFELWEPAAISSRVQRWPFHFPDLVRVTTSQDAYGLPRAGGPDDCPHDEGEDGCLNYIIKMQDFVKHPEGSESSNRLPEVLWSGEVHGNEQVGPTAVLEAAGLLLDAATCTSLPRVSIRADGEEAWEQELAKARECRIEMAEIGISDDSMRWLARLVSTRRLVIVPTANALGYYQKVREEAGIDPNRDFPYDLRDPTACMQTIAGRTLNEVFREHMFQLSLTFHGGMEVIGYEWGAPSYRHDDSPDDIAQENIASAYSRFAGGWDGTKSYAFGSMNSLVYPVRGGMEDWAYAGSWDKGKVIQCQPKTHGGYPPEKTSYDESTLRVFNMLIETSDHKIPSKDSLGTNEDLLNPETPGNGHISRNIRLALLAAELVEPYVAWKTVNGVSLSDDIVPLVHDAGVSCQLVAVPSTEQTASLKWSVGGSLQVDSTRVWYAKWDDVEVDDIDGCLTQPSFEMIKNSFTEGRLTSVSSGHSRFSTEETTIFEAHIDCSEFENGEKIIVYASATVDQNWASQGDASNVAPPISPQAHIVNARTNTDWHHEKDGKVIDGRLRWFSSPLTIEIGTTSSQDTVEESYRMVSMHGTNEEPSFNAGITSGAEQASSHISIAIAVVLVAGIILIAGLTALKNKMRFSRREQIREFIDDASAPSPGLQKKGNGGNYSDVADNDEIELGEFS